jgi:hypothetical protein
MKQRTIASLVSNVTPCLPIKSDYQPLCAIPEG